MEGSRKFWGFVIAIILYTIVLIVAIIKMPQLIVDLSVLAVQAAVGYSFLCGLFFGSNVAEHFSKKDKNVPLPTTPETVQ